MKCTQCGYENAEGTEFCAQCGASIGAAPQENTYQQTEQYQQPQQYQQSYQGYANSNQGYANANQQSYQQSPNYNVTNIPPEYQPITMWGYFGYELLFAIPIVGFIILLVFSFGGTQNKNLKNFARSYFCFLIVVVAIIAVICLFTAIYAGSHPVYSAYRY